MSELEQLLDYADPNHPTKFWRKQRAKERLKIRLLEIVQESRNHMLPIAYIEKEIQKL